MAETKTTAQATEAESTPDILLTDRRDDIIRKHVYASAGVGLVPIPFVDVVGTAGVQLAMMKKLSDFYEVDFNQKIAKKILISVCGGLVPAIIAPGIKSLVKLIPIVGFPLVIASTPVLEATSTYAIGRIVSGHFEKGGNFINFNFKMAKEEFAAIVNDEELKAKLMKVIYDKKDKKDKEAVA
ncbi:MAG: DUF697 domain-containing protein [Oscillospiraceae bacterium]|nr:DUF697 domain-containing protein [Oscillospiraceae bacterium]